MTPDQISAVMAVNGFAIVRGIVSPDFAEVLKIEVMRHPEELRQNGAMPIPPDRRDLVMQPNIQAVFAHVLGADFEVMTGWWETCFLFAHHRLRGTVWHQEAETIPEDTLLCWVNLTPDSGTERPGIGLVAKALTAIDPVFLRDADAEASVKEQALKDRCWPVVYPELGIGDAVFMTRYTIHRTYVAPGMGDLGRLAYKITARKV